MKETVIIGFGNTLMADDGVGVRAIEELQKMGVPEGIELVDGGTSALDVISYLEGKRRAIFIDAVKNGQPPGTIYRFALTDVKSDPRPLISLHSINLADAVQLWDLQLEQLPEIVVFGVEPEKLNFDLNLSPPVREILPRLCQLVLEELRA